MRAGIEAGLDPDDLVAQELGASRAKDLSDAMSQYKDKVKAKLQAVSPFCILAEAPQSHLCWLLQVQLLYSKAAGPLELLDSLLSLCCMLPTAVVFRGALFAVVVELRSRGLCAADS